MATVTWRDELRRAERSLRDPHAARILVEEASRRRMADLFADLDGSPSAAEVDRLERLLARRASGEPLQHIVGEWPFRTVMLTVDRRALIPRPETEFVVEVALAELRAARRAPGGLGRAGSTPLATVVDLGTGSGAVACAIAAECADVEVLAVDRSAAALELAAENRERLAPDVAARIEFVQGSWYEPIAADRLGTIDCAVANPPYLAVSEWAGLDPLVRDYDPYEALVAGDTGLEDLEVVISGAPAVLRPGGVLVTEIGAGQGRAVLDAARVAGARRRSVQRDLAGRDRVLVAWF